MMALPRIHSARLLSIALDLAVLYACFLPAVIGNRTFGADLQANQWLVNPLQWTFEGDSLRTLGRNAGFAVLQAAPISTRVSIEAEFNVAKGVGESWKVVGVAVVRDQRNFWHFALVQSPDSQKQHTCELSEMRDGNWLAQGNLRVVVRESKHEPWQFGQRCRLRIVMDPEGIEGVLADREGRVLERVRYAFSGDAVKSGRPAFHCQGFEAKFTNIVATHSQSDQTPPPVVLPYQSGSFVKEISGKKTGFFHVEQHNGAWWAIDPLGRGFVPLGVDHASYVGHWCEKLGYAPYGRKNDAKYGNSAAWAKETLGRLHHWGFNLLGAGCSPEMDHRGLAHTSFVAFGSVMADQGDALDILPDRHIPCSAFPNVFHPRFEEFCRYRAHQECQPHVGDPWLFGYFLDNELAWWGDNSPDTGLFDAVMRKSASHTAKRALRDFLAERYGKDIAIFNQAWGTQIESFDKLLDCNSLSGPRTDAVLADKKAFVARIADRYFSTLASAIRSVDPDHMILGCRFAGGVASEGVWQAAGRYCDILSFNYYGNVDLTKGIARADDNPLFGKPLPEVFQKFYNTGQRPMMVTEWSFPAMDAGLPSIHGAGQRFRTQAERAKATEITARTMLSLPYMVGYDYFMWVDEPALGISKAFPEDSNYGLVNEDSQPYELLTAAFTRVHQDSGRLRREGLSRAGVATSDTVPASSQIVRFLEKQPAPTASGTEPHPALRFERQGVEFSASNGPWQIRGKIDGPSLTSQLQHRGLVMGRFQGMVQQFAGQNHWVNVERLSDVRATVGPTVMTLDLIGRYDAPQQSPRRSFEIAYRLTLLPECDWFVAQLLWCRNTSDQPLDLRALYFLLNSEIAGSTADDLPASLKLAPRLWGAVTGDAWLDEKAGAFWGLVAGDADILKINFWLDDHEQQHPDARLELERRLGVQEMYRPAAPLGVLCLAGRGNRLHWETQARKVLNSLVSP